MALSKPGHAPVKHLATKILITVNYCGHQLDRLLGWAAPAYHKKEDKSRILERARIACSMMGGLMGALGCRLGHRS